MAPSSSFVILAITIWTSSHLLVAQSIEVDRGFPVEMSNDAHDSQPLMTNGKLMDLASELGMDYLFEDNKDGLQSQVQLGKRDPPSEKREDGDDRIRSIYQNFVRRNIPPSLVKFNYGKRSGPMRSPFTFGKREVQGQNDDGLVDEAKRGYSRFMFGKRENESPNWDQTSYKSLFETEKRGAYSPLYFGKRVPEMAKKGFSRFYFGKRDLSDNEKRFSKFIFGKRENGEDNETILNEQDKKIASNFELENREELSPDKRYRPAFYFGKRVYLDEQQNTNDVD